MKFKDDPHERSDWKHHGKEHRGKDHRGKSGKKSDRGRDRGKH